ncbi:hypothetical protein GSI_04355 [Ganoderma sinense ZZ0214-1]|uniref:Uncharacterized protein n=1 Tax=Ganoderma sinense ZZ0214-1 TaxID=1077348 RepID=A0A2G8SJ12_9APHY|nr:hypothetical protein GSI_04355 [Ganoderma sinense ZZ0214-1]
MPSSITPPLGAYATIRMDPTAMVAHLDAQAVEEAGKIRPKTYLILTSFALTSLLSGGKWFVYDVRPVGPSLRAVDEKRGYESDMCVPIFPNEAHPAGRTSARPATPFPYDNCYHWAGLDLDVRVRAREEGFDKTHATRLPAGEQIDMDTQLRRDLGRAKRTRLAREQAASVPPSDHPSALESLSPPPGSEVPAHVVASDEADIFEPPEDFEDPEYMPLVDLWLNLVDNLKQEDIGDPVDLYRERFAIMNIIKRAHERNPYLPTLREYLAPPEDSYVDDSDCDSFMSRTASSYVSEADESELSDEGVSKPKRFRPAKLLRKLGSSVRGLLCF